MNGHWIERFVRHVWEGPYVDDKQHGRWVIRYADGRTQTETYIAGEIQ